MRAVSVETATTPKPSYLSANLLISTSSSLQGPQSIAQNTKAISSYWDAYVSNVTFLPSTHFSEKAGIVLAAQAAPAASITTATIKDVSFFILAS